MDFLQDDEKPLTKTELVVAKGILEEKKPAEIGEAIGLSARQVKNIANQPNVKAHLASYLDRAGASLEKSAEVIADAHNATEKKFFAFEGRVVDEREVVDHDTRLAAAKLNLQARGELKEGGVQFNAYMELTDEQLAMIATGMKKLSDFIGGPR